MKGCVENVGGLLWMSVAVHVAPFFFPLLGCILYKGEFGVVTVFLSVGHRESSLSASVLITNKSPQIPRKCSSAMHDVLQHFSFSHQSPTSSHQ